MDSIKDFCGYLLGLAFCAIALILCGIAWIGLENAFGWQWALGGVALAAAVRLNIPVVVGLYFYAQTVLGWPMVESIAFALPGFLILTPGVAVGIFGFFVGVAARR